MRLTTIVSSLLLAASAHAAGMQAPSHTLVGGHTNAGSSARLAPATPSPGGLGSAGATVGGLSHGDILGTTLSVAGGYWAVESALAAAGAGDDFDGDGVPDGNDNCIEDANPLQVDADLDGYGNACDYDYDDNGVADLADMSAFLQVLGSTTMPVYDADGNGVADLADMTGLLERLGTLPGPSAFR